MEILKEGNQILRTKAKRVANVDDSIRTICFNMVQVMLSSGGIGLSGNQVGHLKRIIVVSHNNIPIIMINPEIIESSNRYLKDREGCLSIPERTCVIDRHKSIKIKYRDTKGKPRIETYDGLTARIIQHEIDHLDGILMTDYNK